MHRPYNILWSEKREAAERNLQDNLIYTFKYPITTTNLIGMHSYQYIQIKYLSVECLWKGRRIKVG